MYMHTCFIRATVLHVAFNYLKFLQFNLHTKFKTFNLTKFTKWLKKKKLTQKTPKPFLLISQKCIVYLHNLKENNEKID